MMRSVLNTVDVITETGATPLSDWREISAALRSSGSKKPVSFSLTREVKDQVQPAR